jgi:F0F1-type ATP synthase, alpha subunit
MNPFPVAKEVVILFALTHGHLDKLEVADVLRYQNELFDFMDSSHKDLEDSIAKTGNLPEGDALETAIKEFDQTFQPSKHESDAAANNSEN